MNESTVRALEVSKTRASRLRAECAHLNDAHRRDTMPKISVTSAAALAGVHRRTIRRWFGDDEAIDVQQLLEHCDLPLLKNAQALLLKADEGDAEASNEVALELMGRGMHGRAVYWLQRAADRGNADAMHWLGRAYLEGKGVDRNEDAGIMWLAKSATHGHKISQAQMAALRGQGRPA